MKIDTGNHNSLHPSWGEHSIPSRPPRRSNSWVIYGQHRRQPIHYNCLRCCTSSIVSWNWRQMLVRNPQLIWMRLRECKLVNHIGYKTVQQPSYYSILQLVLMLLRDLHREYCLSSRLIMWWDRDCINIIIMSNMTLHDIWILKYYIKCCRRRNHWH